MPLLFVHLVQFSTKFLRTNELLALMIKQFTDDVTYSVIIYWQP